MPTSSPMARVARREMGSMAVPGGAGQLVLLYEAEGLPSLVLGSDLPLLGGLEIDDGGLGTLDDRGFPTWASATLIAASALLLWSLTRPLASLHSRTEGLKRRRSGGTVAALPQVNEMVEPSEPTRFERARIIERGTADRDGCTTVR